MACNTESIADQPLTGTLLDTALFLIQNGAAYNSIEGSTIKNLLDDNIYNINGDLTSNRNLNTNGFDLTFENASFTLQQWTDAGWMGIGGDAIINNTLTVVGSGTTATTFSAKFQDGNGTDVLRIQDDGRIDLGGITSNSRLNISSTGSGAIFSSGSGNLGHYYLGTYSQATMWIENSQNNGYGLRVESNPANGIENGRVYLEGKTGIGALPTSGDNTRLLVAPTNDDQYGVYIDGNSTFASSRSLGIVNAGAGNNHGVFLDAANGTKNVTLESQDGAIYLNTSNSTGIANESKTAIGLTSATAIPAQLTVRTFDDVNVPLLELQDSGGTPVFEVKEVGGTWEVHLNGVKIH